MPQDNKSPAELSIVIPFYNEQDNVCFLHAQLLSAVAGYRYELVYVNDGSTDATYARLRQALASAPARYAKIINLPRNLGQSFAFKAGLDHSRFPVVVFMDGDLQNDPADIPRLLQKLDEGYDLVQGVRYRRQDPFFSKIFPSAVANVLLRFLCGSKFRDIGCSLKIFKKNLASRMVFQQGMHRILPLYFHLNGARVTEIRVAHRRRMYGKTKYGPSRILEVIFEIVKINFFEKNSNRFLFISGFLSFVVFSYGFINGIIELGRYPQTAIMHFAIALLGVYVFVLSAVLYISRSFYLYFKNAPALGHIEVEFYER
ncbi:MAG TPA: glycosyltransferase family 2 protein [Patescibacteria group bacterium]|nr:glycosyltransferase family 2 protein [Patescibacteria group bacterium]